MPQLHLNDGVTGAAIVVLQLRHPDVAPGEAPRVVEGGYGPDLTSL